MRMGQASLYRVLYARAIRGRVLGRLTFWSYLTIVPSILVAGWLLDLGLDMCRVAYPLAGLSGLIACWFYSRLRLPEHPALSPQRNGDAKASGIRAGVRNVRRVMRQDRAYLLFQIAFFLSGSAFFMSTHIILLLTHDQFDFDAFELAVWLSVVPQLLLAVASPAWGHVLDRWGIVRCRLLISFLMTAYLASYLGGIVWDVTWLIYLGSVLLGITNGGGQLTWSLASSHFAPRIEDVPLYNGIHFVLNGIRGLVMPWVGSALFVLAGGPVAVLGAVLVSLGGVFIVLRALDLEELPSEDAPTHALPAPRRAVLPPAEEMPVA
jgi:MFS family permease